MIKLTNEQTDALLEICNVGASRAALQLSRILGDEITIKLSDAKISELDRIAEILHLTSELTYTCVYQKMQGGLNGLGLLVFSEADSATLVDEIIGMLLPSSDGKIHTEYKNEAMMELCNIIVSSSIGAMSDMLREEIKVSVPTYLQQAFPSLLRTIVHDYDNVARAALAISATLKAESKELTGKLFLIFELEQYHLFIESLNRLLRS